MPERLRNIITPLHIAQWEAMLEKHPDREYVDYLLNGIKGGFRIGYGKSGSREELSSARKNMQSATENADVVSGYLQEEMRRGVLLGPFHPAEIPGLHINRFGVIPKSGKPGKWRLIVDLSHPEGRSVNSGIDPQLCSLSYVRLDQVVEQLLTLGPGTQLAKLDIKSAYRIVPVHPEDRMLLGMQWQGEVYVDAALPFGLRSAPKIFNSLADALAWILNHHGVEHLWHYLDDFLTCGKPGTDECLGSLQTMVEICRNLGVPLAIEKLEGPATCLTFLGIVIDTILQELRLPEDKLKRCREVAQSWLTRKRCTKRELLSVAGQLQHAATVVKPGRTFLRRLFDLSKVVKHPDHHLRLSAGARSDLAWWSEFLEAWNGVSWMIAANKTVPDVILTSDASGSWGCGAFWEQRWFQVAWEDTSCSPSANITVKELIPIIIAAALWGKEWQGKVINCCCDNQAVVAVLQSRSSKEAEVMHLLRCLFFFEAVSSFHIQSSHIAGVENTLADDISRNKLSSVLQVLGPQAEASRVTPSQLLLDLLINVKPDWTLQAWRRMFNGILSMV